MDGHLVDWLVRRIVAAAAIALVFAAACFLEKGGNTNICERGIVDPSLTVPVLVDHPDGTVSTEYVPRFTQDKPFQGTGVFYMGALILSAVMWLVVTGG